MRTFWENRWEAGTGVNEFQRARLHVIREKFPSDAPAVLDIGCGTGWLLEGLRSLYRFGVGMDFALAGLRKLQGHRVAGACTLLPFRANSFDLALCAEIIEHLDDASLEQLLAEVRRVTRRYILVTTPHAEKRALNLVRCNRCLAVFHSSLHVRSFTEQVLRQRMSAAGFRPVWIKTAGVAFNRPLLPAKLNQLLTGYYCVWEPNLSCPVCGNRRIEHRRARENPVSLFLEGLGQLISLFRPRTPHSLCGLFEKS